MRIWHLMVIVLASGIIFALLAQVPVLGVLVLLDVLAMSCARLLLRYEPRIEDFWSCTSRPDRPRRLGERLSLWLDGLGVILYQGIGALVITIAVILLCITAMMIITTFLFIMSGMSGYGI